MSLLKNTTLPGEWPGQCRMSKVKLTDRNLIAFGEPAVRCEIAHAGHAEARAARHHIVEQELVVDVRTHDLDLQRVAQIGGAADMIDMAMGQPDLFDRHVGLLDRGLNLVDVAAGVDHHGFFGGFAPDQRAVLLEQRDGNDEGAGFGFGFGLLGHAPHNADFLQGAKRKISAWAGNIDRNIGTGAWHLCIGWRLP